MSDLRSHKAMFPRVQLVLACLLVATASGVVLLWLLLLGFSSSAQSGLMPWVAAGVVLYGWLLVVLAAAIGLPGVLWASYLTGRISPSLGKVARLAKHIGIGAIGLGFASSVAVFLLVQSRPKDPYDGCVSYRTDAASAAMRAPGAKPEVDCPSR